MEKSIPIPDFLPVPENAECIDVEDAALELYQGLADAQRRMGESERRAQAELAEQARGSRTVIVALAAERFEFARLMRRIAPELERLGANDVLRVLDLHARAWDHRLTRNHVEVRDLTGFPLSDELLENVEVEAAVLDPAVAQSEIRETLSPLVLLHGQPIGISKVVTSVYSENREQS